MAPMPRSPKKKKGQSVVLELDMLPLEEQKRILADLNDPVRILAAGKDPAAATISPPVLVPIPLPEFSQCALRDRHPRPGVAAVANQEAATAIHATQATAGINSLLQPTKSKKARTSSYPEAEPPAIIRVVQFPWAPNAPNVNVTVTQKSKAPFGQGFSIGRVSSTKSKASSKPVAAIAKAVVPSEPVITVADATVTQKSKAQPPPAVATSRVSSTEGKAVAPSEPVIAVAEADLQKRMDSMHPFAKMLFRDVVHIALDNIKKALLMTLPKEITKYCYTNKKHPVPGKPLCFRSTYRFKVHAKWSVMLVLVQVLIPNGHFISSLLPAENLSDIEKHIEARANGEDVDMFKMEVDDYKNILEVWNYVKERAMSLLNSAKVSKDDVWSTGYRNALKTMRSSIRNHQGPLWSMEYMKSQPVQDLLARGKAPNDDPHALSGYCYEWTLFYERFVPQVATTCMISHEWSDTLLLENEKADKFSGDDGLTRHVVTSKKEEEKIEKKAMIVKKHKKKRFLSK